MDMNILDFSEW